MSVISPFLPLMATEVRLSTEPVGLTLKVASRPFLTSRSAGGFAPFPSLVIFTVTVLAAASNLTHFPSLCVLLALSSADQAAGAASRQATAVRAKRLRRAKIGIGFSFGSGAIRLGPGARAPGGGRELKGYTLFDACDTPRFDPVQGRLALRHLPARGRGPSHSCAWGP